MSLPTVSGRGFLISDGVELKFSQSGNAWARLPLSFKNRRQVDGEWTHDKEILLEAMVFGPLAEFLTEQADGRCEIDVTGELYTEDWTDKQGETKRSVKLNVHTANVVQRRERVAASSRSRDSFVTDDDSDVPF